jgi:predicted RNA-binding Zn ribbon-like protein
MPLSSSSEIRLIGERLAVDFANTCHVPSELSWDRLIHFLEATKIISPDRGAQLLGLPESEPQTAEALLRKARRLRASARLLFSAMVRKQKIAAEWIESINEVLRITEGHDELVPEDGIWRMEFIAREGGLDWLLAAVARSAADIVSEGARARLRVCANPECGLFFYDESRTRRRRWCSMAVCGNRSKVAAFARKHAPVRRSVV